MARGSDHAAAAAAIRRAIADHCDARDDGQRMLDALRGRFGLADARLVATGPAVGAHAGRGTLPASLQPVPGQGAAWAFAA